MTARTLVTRPLGARPGVAVLSALRNRAAALVVTGMITSRMRELGAGFREQNRAVAVEERAQDLYKLG